MVRILSLSLMLVCTAFFAVSLTYAQPVGTQDLGSGLFCSAGDGSQDLLFRLRRRALKQLKPKPYRRKLRRKRRVLREQLLSAISHSAPRTEVRRLRRRRATLRTKVRLINSFLRDGCIFANATPTPTPKPPVVAVSIDGYGVPYLVEQTQEVRSLEDTYANLSCALGVVETQFYPVATALKYLLVQSEIPPEIDLNALNTAFNAPHNKAYRDLMPPHFILDQDGNVSKPLAPFKLEQMALFAHWIEAPKYINEVMQRTDPKVMRNLEQFAVGVRRTYADNAAEINAISPEFAATGLFEFAKTITARDIISMRVREGWLYHGGQLFRILSTLDSLRNETSTGNDGSIQPISQRFKAGVPLNPDPGPYTLGASNVLAVGDAMGSTAGLIATPHQPSMPGETMNFAARDAAFVFPQLGKTLFGWAYFAPTFLVASTGNWAGGGVANPTLTGDGLIASYDPASDSYFDHLNNNMIPLQRSSFTLSTPNGPLQTIFRDTQQFGRVVDIFRHPQSGENFVVTLRQDSIALLMDQQLQEQTFAALTEDTARYERATDAEVYYWGVGQYFEGLGVTMASYQGKPAKRASAAHDNTVLQAAGPDSRIVGLHTKADLPITTGEPWMVMHNEPAKTASPAGMPVALGGQGRTWAKYLDPQAGETTIRSYFSRERFIYNHWQNGVVTQPLSDTDIIAHALSTYSSAHHQVNEFLVGIFDAWRLRTTLPPSVLAQAEALTRTTRGWDGVITHDDRVGVVVGLALTEIRAQTGYSNLANAIVTGVAPSFLASDNIPLIAQASDAELILSGMANAWQRYQNECVARGRTSWGETHFMYQLDRPGAAAPRVVRRVPVLAPGNSMQGGGFKEQTGSCLWEFKGRSSHFLISIARSSTDGKPRVYWNNSGAVVSPKSDLFDSIYPRWVDKMGQRGLDTFHEIHMDGTVPTSDILRRFEVDCS